MSASKVFSRGLYGQIYQSQLTAYQRKVVDNLFEAARQAAKTDEHGSWELGSNFDRKGRGQATSWDLYGIGRDLHTRRQLIVVQLRQFVRRRRYPEVRKSYFLIGRNEDNTTFAHCIEARVIHAAIRRGGDVVKAAQDWMFGVDYRRVIRQGDICLVPVSRTKGIEMEDHVIMLQDSHEVRADRFLAAGEVFFALNPVCHHLRHTHPDISFQGWARVGVSQRKEHWNFAAPTID